MKSFTGSSKPGGFRLGGATRKEDTREEALRKAKEERAARLDAKKQAKGAVVIQAAWRGRRSRRLLREHLSAAWMEAFSAAAADTSQALPAKDIRERVLPPVLALFLPPMLSAGRRDLLAHGTAIPVPPAGAGSAPLRGALAILIRSLGSKAPSTNYCAALSASEAHSAGGPAAWRSQAHRAAVLCASLLGSSSSTCSSSSADAALLQTAAARCLLLFTERPPTPEGSGTAAGAGADLRRMLAASPAVFSALNRCMALEEEEDGRGKGEGGRPTKSGTALSQTVLAAVLNLLSDGDRPADAAGARRLAEHLLPTHGLAARLPAVDFARLSSPPLLSQMLRAATDSQVLRPPAAALWAAANLSQLAAGHQMRGGSSSASALALPGSPAVAAGGPELAGLYLRALHRLLSGAAAAPGRLAPPKALEALSGLWPLAARNHALQLMKAGHAGGSLGDFCQLYAFLLGSGAAQLVGPVAADKAQLPFLNCLAFAPSLLRQLWSWLARLIGMPLEIPAGTASGWNIASLRGGAANLSQEQGAALGLFCRLLAHILLVVDDNDFHSKEDPFPLSVSRAVATALNMLVFCTHVRDPGAGASSSPQQPNPMLVEWAPVVLRSMHERDLRRPFCPQTMWLAPYAAATHTESEATNALAKLLIPFGAKPPPPSANFSAPAVVRALTNMTGDAGGPQQQAPPIPQGSSASRSTPPSQLATLLLAAPQCVPFAQRVEVFRALVAADHAASPHRAAVIKLRVRRGRLLDDAYQQLQRAGSELKARLNVEFCNEQGLLEAGIDDGGLMKDFIEEVIRAGFNPDYGLFTATEGGQFFPGSQAIQMDHGLGLLYFLGMMVGKAMYEGMLMDLPMAPFFVLRLQGHRPLFDELQLLDEDIYRSLLALKHFEGDSEVMGLDFTLEQEAFGHRETVELITDGADVPVTNANRLQYIALVADWHLNGGNRGRAAAAFAKGLEQMIPLSWLNLFSPKELNEVVGGGTAGDLDVEDMKAYVQYSGGYTASCATIKMFWKVVESMSPEHRAALLKFATSCSRAPLGGFAHLRPPFTIHKVPCSAPLLAAVAGKDVDRLPSASTCYNTLKLPNFRRPSTMKEKLIYAITSNTGFELS